MRGFRKNLRFVLTVFSACACLALMLWGGQWASWYLAGFSAPNLPAAATHIVAKNDAKADQRLQFIEETAPVDDPKTHVVLFRGADGVDRYRMHIRAITTTRWVEMKYERLF
jgi:hypothetical protein